MQYRTLQFVQSVCPNGLRLFPVLHLVLQATRTYQQNSDFTDLKFPVGPVHHRCNTESMRQIFVHFGAVGVSMKSS